MPKAAKTERQVDDSVVHPGRPAKIERKPGWARPKPKTGPRAPKKR